MKAFAQALADLHHIAHAASVQEFPGEAIRLLQKWIVFDGSVLGMGHAGAGPHAGLEINEAYVHNRAPLILDDYAAVSAADPITHSFLEGLAAPLRCDCDRLYKVHHLDALARFSRKHELRHLMIFGNAQTEHAPARWAVMYRATGRPFSTTDAQRLYALWLHLSIAINVNRTRALERIALATTPRALALVNTQGVILAADPMFGVIMRKEWPDFQEISLPQSVRDSFMHRRRYQGKCIDIVFADRPDCIVCSARMASTHAQLSPAENRVTALFSAGMSQKEVARALGVSEHTVRAQLKSSYSKLGVHDKAALARYVVLHS